jgi:hypothetical protein
MPKGDNTRKCTDDEFIRVWRECGSPKLVADAFGMDVRAVYSRRNSIEAAHNIQLPASGGNNHRGDGGQEPNDYLQRVSVDGFSGVAVVFSDAHYWPGQGPSIAHQALVEVVKDLKPKLLIGNGDLFDGARLSRFPRNGWEYQPKVKDELEEAKERLAEVRHAYSRARCVRTIGNHCIRFDRYLATNASEMEQVAGARLSDQLPVWQECISVFVNGNTMIKHRFNGGVHAAYNNTMKSGTNIVTGHTHHLEVKPWGDYRGRRYGVQTGAIADVAGPQFSYTEDNPTPWCSGFAVLTFDGSGRLIYPELCEVIEGVAYFRGQRVAGKRKAAA